MAERLVADAGFTQVTCSIMPGPFKFRLVEATKEAATGEAATQEQATASTG